MKKLLNNSWLHRLILISFSVFLLSINISKPFISDEDFHAARYGLYAENFNTYGYEKSKLGMIEENFFQDKDQYLYNTFSFPTLSILISYIYKIFGISELSTRLIAIFVSTTTILLLYEIGKNIKNELVGFTVAIFSICSPIFYNYGNLITPEVIILPLILLNTYVFNLWIARDKMINAYFFWLLIISTGVALVGWSGYFLALMFYIYSYIFYRKKSKLVLTLFIPFLVVFLLHIYHVYILTGLSFQHNLTSHIFSLNGYDPKYINEKSYSWLKFFVQQMHDLIKLVTVPVLILNFVWWLETIKKWWIEDRLNKSQKKIFIYFLFSIIIPILFPQTVFEFSYFNIFMLPFISLSSAYIFVKLLKSTAIKNWVIYMVVLSFAIGIAYRGLFFIQKPELNQMYQTAYLIGKIVNELNEESNVIIQTPYDKYDFGIIAQFYSQNNITFSNFSTSVWENQFDEIASNFDYVLTIDSIPPDASFLHFANEHFESNKRGIFTLYKIQ